MNDLKDALSRIADSSAPTPLALERVRGRAKQIRRRRTAVAIVGSAAAVATIAGLGVAFMPGDPRDTGVPPATRSVSPTPTTPTTSPGTVSGVHPVDLGVLDDVSRRAPGSGAYWHDGKIVDADGSTTPLPGRPSMFAKDGETGGWVVITVHEAHAELVKISDAGDAITDPVPTFERGLALDPTHLAPATLTEEDGSWVVHAGSGVFDLGRSLGYAAIAGVTDEGDVVVQVDDAVKVLHHGGTVEELPGMHAAAVGGRMVATADGSRRWTGVDQISGSSRWSLDWAAVNSFSPDSRLVALVGDPQHRISDDGGDWDSPHATGVIWIRDARTLGPVAAFTAPDGGYFWSWTWDGDELVATVFRQGTWYLVRLSSDGAFVSPKPEQAGGRGEEPAYVFAAQ